MGLLDRFLSLFRRKAEPIQPESQPEPEEARGKVEAEPHPYRGVRLRPSPPGEGLSEFIKGLDSRPARASTRPKPLRAYTGPGMKRMRNRSKRLIAFQRRSGFYFEKEIDEEEKE